MCLRVRSSSRRNARCVTDPLRGQRCALHREPRWRQAASQAATLARQPVLRVSRHDPRDTSSTCEGTPRPIDGRHGFETDRSAGSRLASFGTCIGTPKGPRIMLRQTQCAGVMWLARRPSRGSCSESRSTSACCSDQLPRVRTDATRRPRPMPDICSQPSARKPRALQTHRDGPWRRPRSASDRTHSSFVGSTPWSPAREGLHRRHRLGLVAPTQARGRAWGQTAFASGHTGGHEWGATWSPSARTPWPPADLRRRKTGCTLTTPHRSSAGRAYRPLETSTERCHVLHRWRRRRHGGWAHGAARARHHELRRPQHRDPRPGGPPPIRLRRPVAQMHVIEELADPGIQQAAHDLLMIFLEHVSDQAFPSSPAAPTSSPTMTRPGRAQAGAKAIAHRVGARPWHPYRRNRGSRTSRSQSPRKMKPRTARLMATPGNVAIHHAVAT